MLFRILSCGMFRDGRFSAAGRLVSGTFCDWTFCDGTLRDEMFFLCESGNRIDEARLFTCMVRLTWLQAWLG